MRDMQDLKDKSNAEHLKAKTDEKMILLEKERDWFRREALKLNKIQKDQKRILDRMKEQILNAQDDRDYYQMQLHEERLNSKALVVDNMKAKMVTEMGGEIRQSQESVQRIQKDLLQVEESDAVKEYKFITQQIDEIARGKSPGQPLSEDAP